MTSRQRVIVSSNGALVNRLGVNENKTLPRCEDLRIIRKENNFLNKKVFKRPLDSVGLENGCTILKLIKRFRQERMPRSGVPH